MQLVHCSRGSGGAFMHANERSETSKTFMFSGMASLVTCISVMQLMLPVREYGTFVDGWLLRLISRCVLDIGCPSPQAVNVVAISAS